ncbi:MAG: glycosyltransferase [Chitinophagaceae bacterium]
MLKPGSYILWLASWYPNKIDPFAGDFIQRHAKAASIFVPLTVFYVSQAGIRHEVENNLYEEKQNGNLTEVIILFKFRKTGFQLADKIIYNFAYYRTYRKAIRQYFQKTGIPSTVHVHVPVKAGGIALWIKRRWGIPYFVTEHSTHYKTGTEHDFLKRSYIFRSRVAEIFKNASAVTNVSTTMGNIVRSIFNLPSPVIINNTVDEHLFFSDNKIVKPFRFIHVSTLIEEHKNVQGIIRSVALLAAKRNDFDIVIVGPATETLRMQIEKNELKKIIQFTGEISYPAVAIEMQKASALLLFSWYENSPCVIGEALCCGLPVLSSEVGGISELINESNGLLVRAGDEHELATAMEQMIDTYSKFDKPVIAEQAKQKFSYPVIGKKFYELYRNQLEILQANNKTGN